MRPSRKSRRRAARAVEREWEVEEKGRTPDPGGDRPNPVRDDLKETMSRESVVQILGAVVAAATVFVTVLAVAHLFSI